MDAKHDIDLVRPHRKFDLAVCKGVTNHWTVPLCTCSVFCPQHHSWLSDLTEGRKARLGSTELRLVDVNDSRVSVMYGRATWTSITVVSKFPTKT